MCKKGILSRGERMDEDLTLIREWHRSILTKALQSPLSQKHWAGNTLQSECHQKCHFKSVIENVTKSANLKVQVKSDPQLIPQQIQVFSNFVQIGVRCTAKFLYLAHKPDCLQAGGSLLSSWTLASSTTSSILLLLLTKGGAVRLVIEALWLPQLWQSDKMKCSQKTEEEIKPLFIFLIFTASSLCWANVS